MEPEELFNFDSSLMEEDTDPVGGDVDVNAGVKTLCRYALPSLIERLGVSLEGVTCRFEDTAITRVPEHRADHVLVLDGPKPAETGCTPNRARAATATIARRRWRRCMRLGPSPGLGAVSPATFLKYAGGNPR